MQELSATMEKVYTIKKYREYYKEHKSNPSDKAFFEEYKSQIILYENTLSELKKSYSKLPNSKDILSKLDKLQEKKNTLIQESSSSKSTMESFIKYERTMEFTWVKRWRDKLYLLYLIEEISITFSSPKNSFTFPNISKSLVGIYIIKFFFALVIHT